MVKLCVVLVMVAAVLPRSAFAKHISCRMQSNCCSLVSLTLYADEVMQTDFTSPKSSTLTKVQFLYSSVAAIPPSMFESFPKLKTLDASNSRIQQIYSSNFKHASALESLNLRSNNIYELTEEAFKGANRLEMLDVSDNEIATIDSTAFKHLFNLKSLKLNDNRITQLQNTVFDDLSEMEKLELQQNDLSTIEDQVFKTCPSLTILNLSHNGLRTFHLNQFERRYSFDLIDVSHNHLEFVNIPSSLRRLDATENKIRTVEKSGPFWSSLISLKMAKNKMSSLDDLPTFGNLTLLDLSYNKIYEYDSSSMKRFPKLKMYTL